VRIFGAKRGAKKCLTEKKGSGTWQALTPARSVSVPTPCRIWNAFGAGSWSYGASAGRLFVPATARV